MVVLMILLCFVIGVFFCIVWWNVFGIGYCEWVIVLYFFVVDVFVLFFIKLLYVLKW